MLVLFFPGWGTPPHGMAKRIHDSFSKSNYEMALASYLSVLKVTAQATEKGMDTATKPQLLFK